MVGAGISFNQDTIHGPSYVENYPRNEGTFFNQDNKHVPSYICRERELYKTTPEMRIPPLII